MKIYFHNKFLVILKKNIHKNVNNKFKIIQDYY